MTRADLHHLLDAVPEAELDRARAALEPLADPFLLALAHADEDDEPESDDERAAMSEVYDDVAAGRVRPWDDVRQSLASR